MGCSKRFLVTMALFAFAALSVAVPAARAQNELFPDLFASDAVPSTTKPAATVSATLTRIAGNPAEAELAVTISLPEGTSTYGLDPKTAQKQTEITVEAPGLTPIDDAFRPDRDPKMEYVEVLKKNVGKFHGSVTFLRRYKTDPTATGAVTAKGVVKFLYCDDLDVKNGACRPAQETYSATLTDATPGAELRTVPASEGSIVSSDPSLTWGYRIVPVRRRGGDMVQDPVRVQFVLAPADAKPGDKVTLTISMELDSHWHTYSLTPGKDQFEKPTEIAFNRIDGLETEGEWTETPAPEVVKNLDTESRLFSNLVLWTREFKRTDSPSMGLDGDLIYQICEQDKQCLPQKALPFSLGEGQPAEVIKDATPAIAIQAPTRGDDDASFVVASASESGSLLTWLAFAFLGGLTLNIMPCVLPVLAIKILSFAQQAGEHRGRILALNLIYTLGVVAVFLALATLAAFASYSWGGLFQKEWFRVSMVLLLFVVGLNLLGTFEIVLPGTVAQAAGGGSREGLFGAFMTGIFATLLATPCSTGWMAAAFAWSLKQSAPVIYLVWGTMGLGMALPYLLVGFFPGLVQLLPRPGMWMVRFKQFSAFAMFGAAIFFLQAVDQRNILPVLVSALGLSLGLWMIGSLYDHSATASRKAWARLWAVLLGGGTCLVAFWMHTEATMPSDHQLAWKDFETEAFVNGRKAGVPMLVDFTADWCAICKTNERRALNTKRTAEFVRENGIVTFVADWTDENDEIRTWLKNFGQESVPLTVIVPADRKAKLITLSGLYSEDDLLKKLAEAMKGSDSTAAANRDGSPLSVAASETDGAE